MANKKRITLYSSDIFVICTALRMFEKSVAGDVGKTRGMDLGTFQDIQQLHN